MGRQWSPCNKLAFQQQLDCFQAATGSCPVERAPPCNSRCQLLLETAIPTPAAPLMSCALTLVARLLMSMATMAG